MKKIYLLLLLLLVMGNVFAQTDRPLHKKTNIHTFKNGKVATYELWDRQQHGKVYAFDHSGKEIYSNDIGYFGGSHHTEFTYYPDGAVKTIHSTHQPDGGIQYYDVTIYYTNDGVVERTDDRSLDGHGQYKVIAPSYEQPTKPGAIPKPSTKKPDVATCAIIYTNEFYLVNYSKVSITVDILRGSTKENTVSIAPGDTVKGGIYPLAQFFEGPNSYYHYDVVPLSNRQKGKYTFNTMLVQQVKVNDTTMKYFVGVQAIKIQWARKRKNKS